MFYCWALRVLLLWGHLARAGVGCWRGQCGTQHNPTLQDGGFQPGKGSHLGQARKTPHTTHLKSYVALGFCHLGQKVETEQVLIAKSCFKKSVYPLCRGRFPVSYCRAGVQGRCRGSEHPPPIKLNMSMTEK